MPSAHWIARRRMLLRKQQASINRNPQGFAAYQTVKHLARARALGEGFQRKSPVRTATVFYDRTNARFGRQAASEFRRRGIQTQELGIVSTTPAAKMDRTTRNVIAQASRAHAVVFSAQDRANRLEKMADVVIAQAEKGYTNKRRGTRLAMMYGLVPKVTRQVLTANSKRMLAFTRKTFDAVNNARTVTVRTPNGTNISFGISRNLRWVQDNGIISKTYWGNLPAGEVFTSPMAANGILVLDGVMNNVGVLNRTPITVQIRNGRAVKESVQCKNPALKQRFLRAISADANANRIGELGLGTNVAIQRLIGNDLADEKSVGVHVAFGDPEGADTGAKWESNVHNDAILRKPTIIVDGRTIMQNGKSLLK
jgi:leucyl aminopeptidase (aminopeptidase T)